MYSESYDPALSHCNGTVWNPLGNGLSYEEFDFPIFSLKDDNDTQIIRQVNRTAVVLIPFNIHDVRAFLCIHHAVVVLRTCCSVVGFISTGGTLVVFLSRPFLGEREKKAPAVGWLSLNSPENCRVLIG